MHGFILLDKPYGLSSNHALQQVKRLLRTKKAGHTGSLDPLATGMLPIALGEATKLCQYLLDASKVYAVTACLGITTTTSDAEGEIINTQPVPTFSLNEIETIVTQFRGESLQTASMYSALKHEGKPLYEYARRGIAVPAKQRMIHVYELEILSWQSPYLKLRVNVSKGTYIRNLVEDIGHKMGCGAYTYALRRISVGHLNTMCTLDELKTAAENEFSIHSYIQPIDAVIQWTKVELNYEQANHIQHGRLINFNHLHIKENQLMLLSFNNLIIGIGIYQEGKLLPKRLLNV